MRSLFLLIFSAGFTTLGVEVSAARLLEPAFGNNQIVWAALIGMILLYLAIGAWVGGMLADRFPQRSALDLSLILAALAVASIPVLAPMILRLAAHGLEAFAPGLLLSALLAIAVLFCAPVMLLGVATPWALRLTLNEVKESGQIAGRLSAAATAGSLLGAFVPVLWLTPNYGTRWTFFLLALQLLAVLMLGNLRGRLLWRPASAFFLVLTLAWWSAPGASIRSSWDDGSQGAIIYEDESLYNYIAVRQWHNERHLKLNDGIGIHSVYHPNTLLSNGIWDYFLLAPLFSKYEMRQAGLDTKATPTAQAPQNPNLLILGLAAGTTSDLYTKIYGAMPITGVELDPQIIEVGRRYFAMNQPNLNAIAADGRRWLAQQPPSTQWEIILVDAYRPPYIPFHLTTVEFFALVRQHLRADGVLAINVGRTASNYELVEALAATAGQIFPSLYRIDEPGPADNLGNSLLVATVRSSQLEEFERKLVDLVQDTTLPAEFRHFAEQVRAQTHVVQIDRQAPVFTDDRAPVERLIHGIIWSFLAQSTPN